MQTYKPSTHFLSNLMVIILVVFHSVTTRRWKKKIPALKWSLLWKKTRNQ